MIDLSIIIPVYNAGTLLKRCIDSIFSQKTNYKYEVIIVDDGSSDNSVDIIRQYKEPNIILIQQSNSGPAKARNKGIYSAHGKYLAFIDADDYWVDGFIEKTLNFLHQHQECIAVSVGQHHYTVSGDTYSPTCIKEYKEPFILNDFFDFWAKYFHICTGSIVILSEITRKIGGQREDLRICEDLEFWALLATYGQLGFIPEILFVSDGKQVTNEIGWVEKNMPRWKSAPTVENWEQRIIKRFGDNIPDGYKRARGKVARNLCYSIIMSKRLHLAYDQVKKYKKDFPEGAMTKILRIASSNIVIWKLVSYMLIYREYHRKIYGINR